MGATRRINLALVVRLFAGLLPVAAIALIDAVIWREGLNRALFALLDEIGHLATAVLILRMVQVVFRLDPNRVCHGVIYASAVLIDVDHIPGELFHVDVLTRGTYRPYGHTVACIVLVAVAGWLLRTKRARNVVAGMSVGIALHLIRDLATGGAALFWPIHSDRIQIPYLCYVALLLVAATIGSGIGRGRRQIGEPESAFVGGPAPRR